MRRRRRTRGTWFPIIGTIPNEGLPRSDIQLQLSVPADPTNAITGIVPVTFDSPQDADLVPAVETLAEIVGNEYLLQRLVGSVQVLPGWGINDSGSPADSCRLIQVFAGFFVSRADGQTPERPIGTSTNEVNTSYRVNADTTIREPWIWRRSWLLSNPYVDQAIFNAGSDPFQTWATAPPTNMHYGSVADGPKLDSKVKRRVGLDDRLYFAVTARSAAPGLVSAVGTDIMVIADVRMYGSLRKARGKSAF